ncbi:PstS family phosphate ABC transporter substrate-binding protein [Bacillus luteolus]|uniref:Phosphate-binding protein n=1 Tax=Litchfieldia luteola TaxID=682179 RepID=A0ABR9QHL1_9BACI|nr:PstS family phosphate ABC transporter substrate-binding protein [Cytobacillus luteolus]MBE4907983.1 PstS family phosphate ABC transporter substrate-binding protein [Cytobacillus luteolus]MBP1942765.1 phosphate transport system substrate-binding protein [Cytobacillus luteolus]
MKNFKNLLLMLTLALFAVFATACGTENTEENNEQTGNEAAKGDAAETAELEGSVVVDGSGTVYPFMAKSAEDYMTEAQENVSVEVSRAGTSAGFKKFLVEDGTDFNNASRKIKDEEAATAQDLGIEVKELKVALDGLTIVINPENDWATELTQQEIIDIFLASAGKKNWSDVRADFPNEPIKTYGPNENHGTYEFFFEKILDEQDLVGDINLQQEYSTLVDLVSKDKNAIGFFGYGYYVNNKDKLTAVKINFGNGAVEPTLDTIKEDGSYAPFTRPVFTYLNVNMAKAKPQVLDFAIYTMQNAQTVAAETGFAPLTDAEIQTVVEELEALK